MKHKIAWLNARPYCWVASTDDGQTWDCLQADDPDDSSEAIEEAADRYGVYTREWELLDEPLKSRKG